MPPMCQEHATVEYIKNMEVMMKIGPRLPCGQGHQTLHLQYFSHLVHLLRRKTRLGGVGDFCWINTDWLTRVRLIAWMVNSWGNWIIDSWSNWFIHLLMMWFFFFHHGIKDVNQNYMSKAIATFTQTQRNIVEVAPPYVCVTVIYEMIWEEGSFSVSSITPEHSTPLLKIATIWQAFSFFFQP